ncbi:hypothetical protein OEZ86_007038 [Tetradesmus obliquus]|nr:hypothetical protein OEZ86_007038 [Tetradesmus obliquus]
MAKTRRRKKRSHVVEGADPSKKPDPQTFVFRRGKHWGMLGDLESDLRRMMLPNTAAALRESKRNSLKDFVSVAGPLGVSHFIMLSATEKATYLRLAKAPRGPTLTLRIKAYSLAADVAASQARPRMPPNAFKSSPLVVLNNFDPKQKQLALAASLFQGMFPSINVANVNLATCQRVVLLSVDPATNLISLRHFTISTAPSGVKKSLKALMARQALPDLGKLQDVSELLTKSGYGSESEGEDAETSRVVLEAPAAGRAGRALVGRQSRVRLHEVGPRLELEIIKVEEGLCGGAVLYHAHVARSKAQVSAQQAAKDEAAKLKAQRRRQQEDNVRRKEAEQRRQAELAEFARLAKQDPEAAAAEKRKQWWRKQQREAGEAGDQRAAAADEDDDDDIAYYRQEVGEEPQEDDKIGLRGSGGRGRGGFRGRGRGRSSGSRGGGRGGGRGSSSGGSRERGGGDAGGGRGGSGFGGSSRGKRRGGSADGFDAGRKKFKKQ